MSETLERIFFSSVQKAPSTKKSKDICPYKKETCTGCNSMQMINSASRWCYESRFDLNRVEDQIRYKQGGRTHVVATGIIDNNETNIEENFRPIKYESNLNYLNMLEKACEINSIGFESLMQTLKRLSKRDGVKIVSSFTNNLTHARIKNSNKIIMKGQLTLSW